MKRKQKYFKRKIYSIIAVIIISLAFLGESSLGEKVPFLKDFSSNFNKIFDKKSSSTSPSTSQYKKTTDKVDSHVPFQKAGITDLGPSTFSEEELTYSKGWVKYGDLDTSKNDLIEDWAKKYSLSSYTKGRTTEMNALIDQDMLRTGTTANGNIHPSGWISGASPINHARGHLLANVLGGSGDDERNLMTIYQNPVNTPYMTEYEIKIVLNAVESGDIVRYRVTPIYNDKEPLFPKEVIMEGKSITENGKVDFKVSIANEK